MSRGTFDVEKKVHLGILAVVVLGAAVALGLGIREWRMQVRSQLTGCGFDSQGAYAKIRLNNPQDTAHQQDVWVNFGVPGRPFPYAVGFAPGVMAPAHGYRAVVVHAGFPPRRSHIEGRTVYVLGRPHENPRFVTKKVAFSHHRTLKHPRGLHIETVPDDPSILHCWIERNPDPD